MNVTNRAGRVAHRGERGATLIEGMVAILIFSIGILAIMGLHAASIKNTTDAQFRSEAAYLANSVIARMRLADQGTVTADFASPSGTQYTQWIADMTAASASLPGMAANPPTIVFAGRQATVTLFWQAQSDGAVRRHVVDTQLDQ
jgi:type IV pilus assembly protein PilV